MHLKFSGKKPAAKSRIALDEPVAQTAPVRDARIYRLDMPETFETAPLSRSTPAPPAPSRSVRGGAPRIKTYAAESMPKAMLLARRELGEDAILIQSKKIDRPSDPGQQYEVTFGIIPGGGEGTDSIPDAPPKSGPVEASAQPPTKAEDAGPNNGELAGQIDALRRELLRLQSMLLHSSLSKGTGSGGMSMPSVYSVLVRNDVDPDLAADLQRAVDARLGGSELSRAGGDLGRDEARTLLGDHLRTIIRTDHSLGGTESESKPVVLVGAPGAGKTTAMMKLAIDFGIKRGRTVEILSMHRGRPEANPALESMTRLLDIRSQILCSPEAFDSALARPRPAGTLVLVDTNGYGVGSIDDDRDFASRVDSDRSADVHLVLPAVWHPGSLRQEVDRFEIFHPTRLLFTMVDQAAVFGPMIEQALRTSKALSFAGSGPAGSSALRPVCLDWVLQQIWDASEKCNR